MIKAFGENSDKKRVLVLDCTEPYSLILDDGVDLLVDAVKREVRVCLCDELKRKRFGLMTFAEMQKLANE